MKKFLAFLVVVAFFVAAPMVMAQGTTKKEPKMIKCCIKGECKDMTAKDCKKDKGKVIKDCTKCK